MTQFYRGVDVNDIVCAACDRGEHKIPVKGAPAHLSAGEGTFVHTPSGNVCITSFAGKGLPVPEEAIKPEALPKYTPIARNA